MVVGSKVLVGSLKVEGIVVEIEETTGSVLVAHQVTVDGKSKNIKQWYSQNTVIETEINIDKTEIEDIPADNHIEFGVLPEKSDSDGE